MNPLAPAVARAGRWLSEVYALDLDIQPERFLIPCELAREILQGRGPRTGLVIVERGPNVDVGLYVDPRDAEDPGTIVEETSHLVCVAWHAARRLPVSGLALELQGEVDRFVLAHFWELDRFAHFRGFRWADWIDDSTRPRYQTAHQRALRYCRRLARRFPGRADTPALLSELRRFYRASPQAKLHDGA